MKKIFVFIIVILIASVLAYVSLDKKEIDVIEYSDMEDHIGDKVYFRADSFENNSSELYYYKPFYTYINGIKVQHLNNTLLGKGYYVFNAIKANESIVAAFNMTKEKNLSGGLYRGTVLRLKDRFEKDIGIFILEVEYV